MVAVPYSILDLVYKVYFDMLSSTRRCVMDDLDPGEEKLYRQWVRIRLSLEARLGKQSGLPAPLAAYVIDHAHDLKLSHVRILREEYGAPSEPQAEELLPLLQPLDDVNT